MSIAADGGSHFWTSVPNDMVHAKDRKLITYRGSKTRDTSASYPQYMRRMLASFVYSLEEILIKISI